LEVGCGTKGTSFEKANYSLDSDEAERKEIYHKWDFTGMAILPLRILFSKFGILAEKKSFPPDSIGFLLLCNYLQTTVYCDRHDEHSHNEERAITLEREHHLV
jgi:hypothetical protein